MRDSTTYQAILEEGRVEGLTKGRAEGRAEGRTEGLSMGRIEEARQLLLRLGRKRFGQSDATVEAAVQAINDLERLELLIERMLEVGTWQELLQTP